MAVALGDAMKKLILLAGLHKTGSTSIQQTCVRNQEALAAQGFHYFPEALFDGRFTTRGSGNHGRLLRVAFRRSPPQSSRTGTTPRLGRASGR